MPTEYETDRILDRLIEILQAEGRNSYFLPRSGGKPELFRALCNLRSPAPVSEEFLRLQDCYLSDLTQKRGIMDVNSLEYQDGIALWQGDIARLNAEAIVNACNAALLGCFQPLHNCIDNVIHSFAGVQVRLDCDKMMKGRLEKNGGVRVTSAYNLPSRYIFHTVGPIVRGNVTPENRRDLQSCYRSCLAKAEEMGLTSIAFCCISTGVFGYPQEEAAALALDTVREWLAEVPRKVRVIFDVFLDSDREIYQKLILA